jgi:hypothetical protein
MKGRLALCDGAALCTWAVAGASAMGAVVGLSRHAAIVAIAFRALTAWRLSVAGGVLWRKDEARASTVRLAALGSAAAHAAMGLTALGVMVLGPSLPTLHRLCLSAARCSPVPAAMLPMAVLGLAHALWLYNRRQGAMSVSSDGCTARMPTVTTSGHASSDSVSGLAPPAA